jgi:hypothetical protein
MSDSNVCGPKWIREYCSLQSRGEQELQQDYPHLLQKQHALRVELPTTVSNADEIQHALRVKSSGNPGGSEKDHASRHKSWKPGLLHPNLSWTHYRTLLRVESAQARSFYEIEATKSNWSAS